MRIESFKAKDWYVEDPLEIIDPPDNIVEIIEKQSIGISVFLNDDTCIGCGGLLFWPDGNLEAWIRIAKRGLEHKMGGIKAIKQGLDIMIRTCSKLEPDARIFCWVEITNSKAQRLVEWLGFTASNEQRELNAATYLMWEFYRGTCNDGSGIGSISCRANSAGEDCPAAG